MQECGVCINDGPVHKDTNHVLKTFSDRDPLPDWVRDLNYIHVRAFTSIANAVPIKNRICALSQMLMHESCSKSALRSHFLRIRLSTRITIRNVFFFFAFQKPVSKAWFERALHSQRVKLGFEIRKRSESRSETASGTWFVLCEQAQ